MSKKIKKSLYDFQMEDLSHEKIKKNKVSC